MKRHWLLWVVVAGLILAYPLTRAVRSLAMTRGGMATFSRLVAAANAQDVDAVRSLCSSRYLAAHPIRPATEGGVVGFPRNIHKNFQVWTEGDEVRLCPTDRQGPVYRLIRERDAWKFDGLAGLLRGGQVEVPEPDSSE